MGAVPDWYGLLKSAQYLKVAPWDLLDQPIIWREWAAMAQNAEAEARKQKDQRAARKKGLG